MNAFPNPYDYLPPHAQDQTHQEEPGSPTTPIASTTSPIPFHLPLAKAQTTGLQRREACRTSLIRSTPAGPRPTPLKKQKTILQLATAIDLHRLSIDSARSTLSALSNSSSSSSSSEPMPLTPPLRPTSLPPIHTIPASRPKSMLPKIQTQPSAHVVPEGMADSPLQSALSAYSQDSPLHTEYNPARVRSTRLRMAAAAEIMARRKVSRKGTMSTLNSAVSVQSPDWLWGRHAKFGDWERQEADVFARERKAALEEERERGFEEWEMEGRRGRAVCDLKRGDTRLSRR